MISVADTSSPDDPAAPPSSATPFDPTVAPTTGVKLTDPEIVALQAVLAGEHAVTWAYGVLGPRTGDGPDQVARDLLVEHVRARDALRAVLVRAGVDPVPAQPAYTVPFAPQDPARAAELAALVEERLTAVYADLVAVAAHLLTRSLAVGGVIAGSRRVARWRGVVAAFPGMPELAPGPAAPSGPTGSGPASPAPTTSQPAP